MQCAGEDVDYPRVSGMSALMSSASARSISVRLPKREMPIQRTAENPRGRCIAVAGPGREDDSGQAVALLTARTSGGTCGLHTERSYPCSSALPARSSRGQAR
jgi:hypothetical protein